MSVSNIIEGRESIRYYKREDGRDERKEVRKRRRVDTLEYQIKFL